MKSLLPTILLLMAFTACSDFTSVEMTSAGLTTWVKGSPEEPFVSAADDEKADQVLVVKARHLNSGHSMDSEVRIRSDESKGWVAFPALDGSAHGKHIYFPNSVGVEVSFSYSVEQDGTETVNDRAEVLVPFGENQKGRAGAFEYEANWDES